MKLYRAACVTFSMPTEDCYDASDRLCKEFSLSSLMSWGPSTSSTLFDDNSSMNTAEATAMSSGGPARKSISALKGSWMLNVKEIQHYRFHSNIIEMHTLRGLAEGIAK